MLLIQEVTNFITGSDTKHSFTGISVLETTMEVRRGLTLWSKGEEDTLRTTQSFVLLSLLFSLSLAYLVVPIKINTREKRKMRVNFA